jgi:hypothetical protein
MHAGIGLMYVEGEIQGGCITGRTVLVIETSCETNPGSPYYSPAELGGIVKSARDAWERQFGPADLVRVERLQDSLPEAFNNRNAAS